MDIVWCIVDFGTGGSPVAEVDTGEARHGSLVVNASFGAALEETIDMEEVVADTDPGQVVAGGAGDSNDGGRVLVGAGEIGLWVGTTDGESDAVLFADRLGLVNRNYGVLGTE